MSEHELSIRLSSALSVAHDFTDAIVSLKADVKILQDTIENNNASYVKILEERQRQIDALVNEVADRERQLNNKAIDENSVSEIKAESEKARISYEVQLTKTVNEKNSLMNSVRELKALIDEKNRIIDLKDETIASQKETIETLSRPIPIIQEPPAPSKKAAARK